MKKKIAILGSTGSIGKSTIDILRKDKKNFDVVLLTTNNNYREILKQAKEFKARNIIINNKKHFLTSKKKLRNNKINIFNNFQSFNNKFKSKIDFSMSAISGLEGLKPTLDLIKFSKTIAIANKESIICAWNLIQQRLNKYKTKFIPVDSEHFSIWSLLDGNSNNNVEEVIITASGGPFLKLSLNKFKKIKPQIAVNHPNWKMGKKISIDSATMMNKALELIEAKYLFNLKNNEIGALIHPEAILHGLVSYIDNSMIGFMSRPDMRIPISNLLSQNDYITNDNLEINLGKIGSLNFHEIDNHKFPIMKIFNIINVWTFNIIIICKKFI
jgi:1-deoxy-D-xylulose-5-phosphate reductoisomerase